jgi:hypothetical protein
MVSASRFRFDAAFTWLTRSGILIGICLPLTARASEKEAQSTCPTPEAVSSAVRSVLGDSRPGEESGASVVVVRDLGDQYLVSVKGSSREYADDARDCAARARVAAVFAALVLSPSNDRTPKPGTGASPSAGLIATQAASGPASRAAREGVLAIEAGILGAGAPRSAKAQLTAGGELRLVVIAGAWGLSFGVALPASSSFDSGLVRVGETRYPADLGIRRLWISNWLVAALDFGAVAAFCRLQQMDRPDMPAVPHVEVGVRAAATLSTAGRWGLYIRAFSEFIPITRQIAVEPQGVVGRTSPFWGGAALGVAARFH